jgi:hypothetical protein
MAYLNANIPPIYCKIRKEYLYDLKEHQGEFSDCVIFGLSSISGRALLFNIMLPNATVRAFGVCLSQRFSKNRMTEPMCRICRRTNFNCGTVSVITLACIALIGWLV